MTMLGIFYFCLALATSSGLSIPEQDVPSVEPEFLDQLLQDKEYELFSKLLKINNVNLVLPRENESTLDPMLHEELAFGDILLPKEEEEQARQGINFGRYPGNKWPSRGVPYAISSDFTSSQRNTIINGINKWNEQVSCIKFVARNSETDYAMFIKGDGCYSYLGKQGNQQPISLGNGCLQVPTILHEMQHCVGFAHEQNRSDRDKFIEILWNNIPEKWQSQYKITNSRDYGLQNDYDYYSVMHYPVPAPGTNKDAFNVLQSGIDKNRIGRGNGFTPEDIKKICSLY